MSEDKKPAHRPPFYDDPEVMQEKIEEYFSTARTVTITGLCLHLGFESRQSFYDYEEKPDFTYIIKKARLLVENAYEVRLNGEGTPTGAIFALKNMGWKDKQETEISGRMELRKPSWFEDVETK
jgi:hypothetical protein